MFGKERRRRKRLKKVKPGDGHRLKPARWWQLTPVTRSAFSIELGGSEYTAVVNYFDWDTWWDMNYVAHLYKDGVHHAKSECPAHFLVPGGEIQVDTTLIGLKRMHFVPEEGEERLMTPDPQSAEGLRARLGERLPALSRALSWGAVVVLIMALLLGIPQLLEMVTQWDLVQERVGTFVSPVQLPAWLNTAMGAAGLWAAFERALTVRYHWLLDQDLGDLGD